MSQSSGRARPRVIVIGAGITGLTCTYRLKQETPDIDVMLLEASSRAGGKVVSEFMQDGSGRSFLLERGADAFLARQKPWAYELACELGLQDEILCTEPGGGVYLLAQKQLVRLPQGIRLIVPGDWDAFSTSPLFNAEVVARTAEERSIPIQRIEDDISVADFVRHRLGDEMLELLGEPLLSGIYSAHPEEQSLLATFPNFARMVEEHGSLLAAMESSPGRQRAPGAKGSDITPFISFRKGTERLPAALAEAVKDVLRLGSPVSSIANDEEHFRAHLQNGETLKADRVVLALPAAAAAAILRESEPGGAEALSNLRTQSTGVAWFAYPRHAIAHPLDGFGAVVPRREANSLNALTFTTSKFSRRAPEGWVLLRTFFGGARTPHMMESDDDQVEALLRSELTSLLGIEGEPHFVQIFRWNNAQPQYDVGHLSRVKAIRSRLPEGLSLAGTAYGGVGIPDCVRQGNEVARSIARELLELVR